MTASVQDTLAQQRIDALLLRVTALETEVTALKAGHFTAGTLSNIAFLATLVQVAHIVNDNSTTDTWDSAGRDLLNGLKAAVVASNLMAGS